MEKVSILTKKQKLIFSEVIKNDFFRSNFYFTGGTALAEFYLHHRESVDLDFFSQKEFDTQTITNFLEDLSHKYSFEFRSELVKPVFINLLKFKNGKTLKVDFARYPYKRIREGKKYQGFAIDSEMDIAINKLFALNQRIQVKDFVDLYFLLKKYSFWDLRTGVHVKFHQDLEPLILASDFVLVKDFEFLPKMLKPLTLEELKNFFIKEAQRLGSLAVE